MKIIPIFVSENSDEGLWTVHFKGKYQNEFDRFFDQVNDIEWLHNFFENNKTDLDSGFWGTTTIEEAVLKTFEEIEEMEDTLYDYTEKGFSDDTGNLQQLFKPLNNYEYAITPHQKSKTRIRKGWLRVYAIRLAKNCYVVTGGAIKLTRDMKRSHLEQELKKLEQTKTFLLNNGVNFAEDLNTYKDE